MTDETLTNPVADDTASAPGVTADGQAAEHDPDREIIEDDDSPATDQAAGPDDDTDEVERDGKKYRIPKALIPELLMNADYTKKTQTLADRERALASERQALAARAEQQAKVDDEVRASLGKVHALSERVGAYKDVDWNALQQQVYQIPDPMERAAAQNNLSAAFNEYNLTKSALADAENEVKTKEASRLDSQRAAHAKALEDTGRALADPVTGIKGWGPELARSLANIAAEFGVSEAELTSNPDPRDWKVLNAFHAQREEITALKAALAKQGQVKRHETAQAVVPAAVVGAKSTPPQRMSDAQSTANWMAARNKAVSKAR